MRSKSIFGEQVNLYCRFYRLWVVRTLIFFFFSFKAAKGRAKAANPALVLTSFTCLLTGCYVKILAGAGG